ncbi:protein kinase [Zymoseptoria brevis]|uniref:Protein kinase n=1 Tax=Zymoseptoria brevis TaxID=1047168 RepID=A0A0F4GJ72_9PEZI|nr:protein kinase [Zymoseptoria brevis]
MPPPLEEQSLPRFHEKRYLPVSIGQLFNDRYRVITKLGYGAYSTVWLARDQATQQYASLKICVRDDSEDSPVLNEYKILRHMRSSLLCDEALRLQPSTPSRSVPLLQSTTKFIMAIVVRLLGCSNWLQLEAGIVHTEITPQNILLAASDDDIFSRAERMELESPSVPVIDHSQPCPYPIYTSRGLTMNLSEASGYSVLTDFGSARFFDAAATTRGWWMPDTYRAPEVLMSLPWGHGVDIWSIGVMVLELLEGRNVFNPIDRVHDQYVLPVALAQYISLMGPPPLWMIQQSEDPVIPTFFDDQGRWTADLPIPKRSFEDIVTVIEPGEEKDQFIEFLKKIFTWDTVQRANSYELLQDEWLTGPLRAQGILP